MRMTARTKVMTTAGSLILLLILAPAARGQVMVEPGSAAAAAVEQALAEGVAHPRGAIPPSLRRNFVARHGSEERRCITVTDEDARSGEFVLQPPSYPLARLPSGRFPAMTGNFRLVPLVHDQFARVTVRATNLNDPQFAVDFRFSGWVYRLGSAPDYAQPPEPEREYFTPVALNFPAPGTWLLVAAHMSNWGCFIVEVS